MNPIPACCTPLDDHWLLLDTLPGTVFLSTRFEPKLLRPATSSAAPCRLPPVSSARWPSARPSFSPADRARAALQQLEGLDCIPAIGEDRASRRARPYRGSITHSTGTPRPSSGISRNGAGWAWTWENLLSLERAERLAGEILTPDELQRMAAGPREQIAQWVTLTFSAKESLFKALYPTQKRFYFEHAEVLEWSEAGSLRLRLLTDLSSEWCYGKELEAQFVVHEGQLLSLVAIGAYR